MTDAPRKVALVTGANQGLGLALVRRLCSALGEGSTVCLASRDTGRGEAACTMLQGEGLRSELLRLDVPGDASVPAAAAAAVDLVWLAALPAGTEHPLRRPGPTSPAAALSLMGGWNRPFGRAEGQHYCAISRSAKGAASASFVSFISIVSFTDFGFSSHLAGQPAVDRIKTTPAITRMSPASSRWLMDSRKIRRETK